MGFNFQHRAERSMIRGEDHTLPSPSVLQRRAGSKASQLWDQSLEYPSGPTAIFALFLGYIVFFYLQGGYRIDFLGRIRFELIAGTVLILASVVSLTVARQRVRTQAKAAARPQRTSNVVGWLVAMLIVAVVMTGLSHVPAISWQVLVNRIIKFAMMTLFIGTLVSSPARLRWFMAAYLLAFLKMVQEGVMGYFSGSLVWENQGTPRLHGATPNYEHPNSFSGTQLGTLPFLLASLTFAPKWLRPVVIGHALGAVVIVVTTGSRTGYVGLLLWLAFVWYRSKSRFKSLLLALVAGLVIVPMLPAQYMARFETIFTQKDAEGASIDTRKEILHDALGVFAAHPLGVGVGAFTTVRQEMFGRSPPSHNLYLEVACDMGIQGLFVFLGFVVVMMRSARATGAEADRQLRQLEATPVGPDWGVEQLGALQNHLADLRTIKAAALAVLSFLVIRMGLGLFGHDFYEIYWWFAAGLVIALQRMLRVASGRTHLLAGRLQDQQGIAPSERPAR